MKIIIGIILIGLISSNSYAQRSLCIDSKGRHFSRKDKKILHKICNIDINSYLSVKTIGYYDTLLRQYFFNIERHYVAPQRYYLVGVGFRLSEGIYMKFYSKKYRYVKSFNEDYNWAWGDIVKEIPDFVQLFYHEELISQSGTLY